MEKIKVKVTIENVPVERFTEEEISLYFDNGVARSLCYKISSYAEEVKEDG